MRYLLLTLLAFSAPALQAQTAIHRCVAADGTPVFTDQPCSSLGAMQATTGGDRPHRAAGGICPATPAALKARIAEAFNAEDANALAGLMLWQGYGRHAAAAGLHRLQSLVRQPLVGFGDATNTGDDAADPRAAVWPPFAEHTDTDPDDGDADTLTLRLRSDGDGDGGDHRTRFGIVPRAGCLWLQP